MDATGLMNMSRKGLLRTIVQQNEALLAGQRDLSHQLTLVQESFLMQLNKNEQAVVDAVNASTNKVADAVSSASQAIKDLFNNQSTITLKDVQPNLDAMDSAADALKKIATDSDPALGQTTTPIVVTDPAGTEVPVSATPADSSTTSAGQPGETSVGVSGDKPTNG